MDFTVDFLSFFVVQIEGQGEHTIKRLKHYQTMSNQDYINSELKEFLDGELMKIAKRKVERNPKSEQVPTKVGRFIVEPGHALDSNPNYNLFSTIRKALDQEEYTKYTETLVQLYSETSAVRGGAIIVIRAKLVEVSDIPFVFILKCDFEQKVASIADEKNLIRSVEMAITTKNMKSIQYPYMPEEGMVEEWEIKVHQSSHARYFEDFLKFVEYNQSMPEIVKHQVLQQAQQYIAATYDDESPEKAQEEEMMEAWANTPVRQLQEKWTPEQVAEVSSPIIEQQPTIELKLKLDHISIKGLLSDFGESIHIAKKNDKYVLVIEGDAFTFEKGFSPVEFVKPESIETVFNKIYNK
ncbi:DUF3900 domain-containing protein [Bacillus alkalicellulosilyticus]|uniref:DUF3900 domain-containing protein n=1 Tax=Alkalihalobacterium alkalicellulosilyticum TaxID=1912214 RepID=UPI000997DC5F|nr:DUF3900 domain-containing protein [Bacillus alkalicellulosilyticus]